MTALPNLYYYRPTPKSPAAPALDADLCVYGGTSAGVAAAVQAARLGLKVVLLSFDSHLGGLTSGGLGATDIGNKAAIGGLSRDFYRRLGKYYSDAKIPIPAGHQQSGASPDEAWKFEPSVAEKIMRQLVREPNLTLRFDQHLVSVAKDAARITQLTMEDGTTCRAKVFVDATYEGDLLAWAGVSYHVGREANSVYDETLSGVHFGHPGHNFNRFVDPYREPANPASGLCIGVFPGTGGLQGDGDHRVQAYNFRMCLTNAPDNRTPFPKPAGYNPDRYELLARYLRAGIHDSLTLTIEMPNAKTDTNNFGGFSSDNIGMNYAWPDGVVSDRSSSGIRIDNATLLGERALAPLDLYRLREEIFQDHVNYQAGLYYFLTTDRRVPAFAAQHARQFGLPKDEFTASSNWPHQLYVREARRMISSYVMTEHDCVGRTRCNDPVSLAAYTMDSHNCNRVVRAGRVINEGNVEVGKFSPYPISYQSIVPRRSECTNLLVPVCLSSSHIAFGSIRMEPVFMILGQSAAHAAALAISANCPVQDVSYPALRDKLQAENQVLEWNPAGEVTPLR